MSAKSVTLKDALNNDEIEIPDQSVNNVCEKNNQKRKSFEDIKYSLKNSVIENHHKIWLPNASKTNYEAIPTNTCYDLSVFENTSPIEDSSIDFKKVIQKKPKKKRSKRRKKKLPEQKECDEEKIVNDQTELRCRRIFIYPNRRQRKIIHLWFDACIDMYNETIKYIKSCFSMNSLILLRNLNEEKLRLNTEIKKLTQEHDKFEKKKISLQKFISEPHERTNANVKKFNVKMTEYVAAKATIKNLNMDINIATGELAKATKKWKKIENQHCILFDECHIRDNVLKKERDAIISKYVYEKVTKISNDGEKTTKDIDIRTHIIDAAIAEGCVAFKSARTNFIEGNTNKFKIRHQKHNKPRKVLNIGIDSINADGVICKPALGEIKMKQCVKGKLIDHKLKREHSVKLHYDEKSNAYSIFEPFDVPVVKKETDNDDDTFVGIDPGLRTFLSCLSNEEAIKIGDNLYKIIEELLKKIDEVNAKDIPQSVKNKQNKKYYRKISNIVDETHWKVINYLTSKFKRIYIGKFSIQDVISNKKSVLTPMGKRVGQMMKHYQFRQRLINKCRTMGIICVEVDERYTSKTCSNCGNYKDDLGGKKLYNCEECEKRIDRDINGCRCILMKNIELSNDEKMQN